MTWSTVADWERLAPDPDLCDDLGYERRDWEVVETNRCGRHHVVFVSNEEPERSRDAYIIAEQDAVCDVLEWM